MVMFDDHQREKLLNAINFFVRRTKHCHTLKLLKLLNFLDFEHYRQTGRSVTGLQYAAWDQGPVPPTLWRELTKSPGADLKKILSVFPVTDDLTDRLLRRDLKAVGNFDESYFSKRELQIMSLLAEIFQEVDAGTMSEFSHYKNLPWRKVYGPKGDGKGREIPYDLSIKAEPILKDMATLSESDHSYRVSALLPDE